jgi:hypothetical protein
VEDSAPPLEALQLMKRQCDTCMPLLSADKAPPLPLGLEQFWNVIPENVTVELRIRKAGPILSPTRRLQSKTVAEATPLITREGALVMLIVDSPKKPELRFTRETLSSWTA